MTDNSQLAARARASAAKAANGSAERKSALVAAVALAEATTPAGARRILDAWDGPAAIKTAAAELIGDLTRQESP